MKIKILTVGLIVAAGLSANAALFYSGTLPGTSIPDNTTLGTGQALVYSFNADGAITDLSLSFSLLGGTSSDLSGYLRLGDQPDSPSYNLTSLVQSQTLNHNTPVTYSIDFTHAGFRDAFIGRNPNDAWTLFFADTAPVGSTMVEDWSLEITAVPEPVNVALGVFGAIAGIVAVRKRFQSHRQAEEARNT